LFESREMSASRASLSILDDDDDSHSSLQQQQQQHGGDEDEEDGGRLKYQHRSTSNVCTHTRIIPLDSVQRSLATARRREQIGSYNDKKMWAM